MPFNRTRTAVGGTRVSAFWRIVGLFVLAALEPFLVTIALIAGVVYMAIDVVKSIVLDKRASGNGMVMGALKGVFMWVIDLHKWVLFGRAFPGFIPSRR